MKKLAFMATNRLRSNLVVGLVASIVLILGALQTVSAADFSCPLIMPTGSAMAIGDVSCLIAKISDANAMPGNHTINLEPGIYTLQMVDNTTDGPNGLPSINGPFRYRHPLTILPR